MSSETARMEAFSDGVFSIAITLLSLNLTLPFLGDQANSPALADALLNKWPSFVAFVTSFASILIMWVNHHGIFRMVRKSDSLFMFANGFLLLLVAATPFPTALLADYLRTDAAQTACVVYGGFFVFINIAYNLLWWSVAYQRRLLRAVVSEKLVRSVTNKLLIGFPLYVLATLAAFWRVEVSVGIVFFLWIVWGVMALEGQQTPLE